MSVRITGDKRECRVLVKDQYEIIKVREELEEITSRENMIIMPDDFNRNNLGYEMIFKNRHSLKEFLCFENYAKEDFVTLLKSFNNLFELAERNNINPYSFVFDLSCIFVENGGEKLFFVYTPENVNETNNNVADVLSLVSMYSGFEIDSEMEMFMRNAMEKVKSWEDNHKNDVSYDFPLKECLGSEPVSDKKKEARMVCVFREKPYLMFFSDKKHTDFVCRMGRDKQWANLKLNSFYSSRHHCEIVYENNNFVLVDLDSKNGTTLNGKKVNPKTKYFLKGYNRIDVAKEKKMVCICF